MARKRCLRCVWVGGGRACGRRRLLLYPASLPGQAERAVCCTASKLHEAVLPSPGAHAASLPARAPSPCPPPPPPRPARPLQATLLHGQKLQGVLTSEEVQEILRRKGWEQDYPLFTAGGSACCKARCRCIAVATATRSCSFTEAVPVYVLGDMRHEPPRGTNPPALPACGARAVRLGSLPRAARQRGAVPRALARALLSCGPPHLPSRPVPPRPAPQSTASCRGTSRPPP